MILLLMTLIMYACCKGYRGKLLPQRETPQGTVSAIYNPTVLYRHGKWSYIFLLVLFLLLLLVVVVLVVVVVVVV